MPPKKDDNKTGGDSIPGFEPRETKLLAAAFLSTIAPDKYDYDLMASLTGYTVGSAKKIFPPVKRKAVETYPSLAAFLGVPANGGADAKAATKPTGKKRKTSSEPEGDSVTAKNNSTGKKKPGNKKAKTMPEDQEAAKVTDAKAVENGAESSKKAPAKNRSRPKKGKAEDAAKDNDIVSDEDGDEI